MTLACNLCHGQATPNAFAPPVASSQPVAYAVTLNEADMGQWILIRQGGNWYATEEAIRAWRIKTDESTPHMVQHEQRWFALQHLPGYRASEDPLSLSLAIWLAPNAFESTHIGAQASAEASVQPVEPALYLNLDVNYTRIQARQTSVAQELAAYTELGLSNSLGVLTSTQIVRQPMGGPALNQDLRGWTRLETTLTRHEPDQRRTLRVGDTATRTGLTGRSVYFGGIQWGTDYGMTPNFSAAPRPVIKGMAPTPGTVELFVNDVLRQTSAVPSGPFSLDAQPMYSTDGQLRVVVRDLLGRETVITQPFFQHANQLEEGLSDWSVAVGAVRRRLGLKSNDYGERFAAGLLRLGLTKHLTAELQGHGASQSQGLGLGMTQSWPSLGIAMTAGAASSRAAAKGVGSEWLLGLEWRRGSHNINLHLTQRDSAYQVLGENAGRALTQGMLNYTLATSGNSTFGLAWARLLPKSQQALTTVSASMNQRLAGGAMLNVTASRARGQVSAGQLTVALQMPVPGQYAQTLHIARRDKQWDAYASASGTTNDTSWRLQAGRQNDQAQANASLWRVADTQTWSADLNATSTAQAMRLGWQGGLMAVGGHVVTTRRIDGSFALVEVPGVEGVKVGAFGNWQATTNHEGLALLTNLAPQVPTPVRLDAESLPLGADITSLEQIGVPGWRSGVKLRFPVRIGRAALVQLLSPDGSPIPSGSEVRLDDEPQRFVVGARGEVFITGLRHQHRLLVGHGPRHCRTRLTLPDKPTAEWERVGPLTCEPEAP